MNSHHYPNQKKNLCPSVHVFSPPFRVAGWSLFLWIWALSSVLHAQPLKESFGSSILHDWYRGNTSIPLPAQMNSWRWHPSTPEVGDADNTTAAYQHYEYAYVGLSPYDYDASMLSKWLISPMMFGLKNGDKIRFTSKAIAGRANRLEVRLNTYYKTIPHDSIYIGQGQLQNDVGHFDNLLLTINPNLTTNGYPSNWTTYEAVISGLAPNEVFTGRVAFRYYITNAGYNNHQPRYELPPPVSGLMQIASYFPQLSDGIEGLDAGIDYYTSSNAVYQVGVNGTLIAIDNVEQISTPAIFMDMPTLASEPNYCWHANNIGSAKTLNMGYKGAPGCINMEGYPAVRSFWVRNKSNAAITITPKTDAISGSTVKALLLDDSLTFTLQPYESRFITVKLRSDLPTGTYTNRVWLQNMVGGANLAEMRITCKIEAPIPPIAKCESYKRYTLSNNGIVVAETQFVNKGSINSCGSSINLSFRFDKVNGDTFTCADLGTKYVNLRVTDNATKATSTCPVQVSIEQGTPSTLANGHVQNYYLRSNESSMKLNTAIPPAVTSGCNVLPQIASIKLNNTDYSYTDALPPGNFTVTWSAGGGSTTSILNVIDTVRPIAICKDTTRIGFTYDVLSNYGYVSILKPAIWGKDLDTGSHDNLQIGSDFSRLKYTIINISAMGSPEVDEIPFSCANTGLVTPLYLKVTDPSGNSSTCRSIIKIASPDVPVCKNVALDLDPTTGTRIITASDLLLSGGNNICGITNASVSKYSFGCNDVNTTSNVTVSYRTSNNVLKSCVAQVTINEYSEDGNCTDTVRRDIPSYNVEAYVSMGPVLNSFCSNALPWRIISNGATHYDFQDSGNYSLPYRPGISYATRTTQYANKTYQCAQVIIVTDTVAPLTDKQLSNYRITGGVIMGNGVCGNTYEIQNPFMVGTYYKWKYTLTGATTKTVIISPEEDEDYYNSYWKSKWDELRPGTTTITMSAYDYAGNEKTVSQTVYVPLLQHPIPNVEAAELDNDPVYIGNYCGGYKQLKIASPLKVECYKSGYMWYYQVRDSYMGNILYEQDSIPQDSGALIPIKVLPYSNPSYSSFIHFGYHDYDLGTKVPSNVQYASARDTLNQITCPTDITVQNTNNVTNTYAYTLSPPAGLCPGSYWGYRVSGVTRDSSRLNPAITYNPHQAFAMSRDNVLDRYPSLAYNKDTTIQLNNGLNTIELIILEESGNLYRPCTYTVKVIDASTPTITCAGNDTLYRTGLNCTVDAVQPCQTVSGFTGPYGTTGFGLKGANSKITLDKSMMPQAVVFKSINNTYTTNYQDAYVVIEVNCSGTVSFNWEYKSSSPLSFNPFVVKNNYNPNAYTQPALSGISTNIRGVLQTGTYSQAVSAGDKIYIGLTEAGFSGDYFRISNFSAPAALPIANIHQPTFAQYPALYLTSDFKNVYPAGDHIIRYTLTNSNNGNQATCDQRLVVMDTTNQGTSLVCANTTLYLDKTGKATLTADKVVANCVSTTSTVLSQSSFRCQDVGTNYVTITSSTPTGGTATCNIVVNVMDTIRPVITTTKMIVDVTSGPTTITFAMIAGLFTENCYFSTVSSSISQFSCSDVGEHLMTVTGTDYGGNTTTGEILVEVKSDGFTANEQEVTQTACQGDSLNLCFDYNLVTGNGANYTPYFQMQVKEPDTTSMKAWNLFPVSPKSGSDIYFFRPKTNQSSPGTYMVEGTKPWEYRFRKLNPLTGSWDVVLGPVSDVMTPAGANSNKFMLDFFDDGTPLFVYRAYSSSGVPSGGVSVLAWNQGGWKKVDTTLFSPNNINSANLYCEDGYFFASKYNYGVVSVGKKTGNGTLSTLNQLCRATNNAAIQHLSYAQNIVGVRGEFVYGNVYNKFFRLNLDASGNITGKDSLTTDPTGNSALFVMRSFEGAAYIAYKSSTGKVSVKKFDSTSAWTNVGIPDFSNGQIVMLDMKEIANTLYVAYRQTNDSIIVQQLVNGNWVKTRSLYENNPDLNTSYGGVSFVRLCDMNGILAVQLSDRKVMVADGWKNEGPSRPSVSCFSPATQNVSMKQYRCLFTNDCDYRISGIQKLVVNKIPHITAASYQQTLFGQPATLTATADTGTIHWIYGTDGPSYTTPPLLTDEVFSVFAQNGPCLSDTVQVNVFTNDTIMRAYKGVAERDTICYGEYTLIRPDTIISGHTYSLYEQGTDGLYTHYSGPYIPEYNRDINWDVSPTQTTNYKILVEENPLNAAMPSMWGAHQRERFDFGTTIFPITNEITVEAWVYVRPGLMPQYSLGLVNSDSASGNRNWEWTYGYFRVSDGNGYRELAFPTIPNFSPDYWAWMHVATTVNSTGMCIYYNGVLVASNTSGSTAPINNGTSNLIFGRDGYGSRMHNYAGFDEFRVWNVSRSLEQINQGMNTCLTGTESGLMLYHDFNSYDFTTSTFSAVKGNDCVVRDHPDEVIPHMTRENAPCMDLLKSKIFSEPVKIVVPENPAILTYLTQEYYSQNDSLCGEMVQVVAHANRGGVIWYNRPENGDVLGTSDTLNIFIDRDTVLYVNTSTSSPCLMAPVWIDVHAVPGISNVYCDTICPGSYIYESNLYIEANEGNYNLRFFDAPVDGNEIDPYEEDPSMIRTETDTLWVEVYNDYCLSPSRKPVIIPVFKSPAFTVLKDTTRYGAGEVTLTAVAPGFVTEWYNDNWEYISGGPTLNISVNSTTKFYAAAIDFRCYTATFDSLVATVIPLPSHRDSIVACGQYTWSDGITYASDTNNVYYKQNAVGQDSAFYLALKVIRFDDNEVIANRTNICTGDSVQITIKAAQNGIDYVLIDTITNTRVTNPITGTGEDITFNTGALFSSRSYRIMRYDTAVLGSKTLACSEQLGNTISIQVGTLFTYFPVAICSEYTWNEKTYTQSGTYYDTLTAASGCDSLLVIQLIIFPAPVQIDSVTACNSYTWHGTTYYASTNAPIRHLGVTKYGCDSIEKLHLTIRNSASTDTRMAWDNYTWINGNTYNSSNNSATHTLTNVYGCDSVVTLNLTILNSAARTKQNPQTICGGTGYTFNNRTHTTSGTYRDTLYNGTGNDTIIVTQLTVNPKPTTSAINGNMNTTFNTTETYSVTHTAGSTYHWIISNGTQISGGNTNAITVQWASVMGNTSLKVVEMNSNGCWGDTVVGAVALPVSMITFTGHKNKPDVVLNWITSSELNNKGFGVERSFEGSIYERIGFVNGQGTTNQISNYQYIDEGILNTSPVVNNQGPAAIYYRLRQEDFNGKYVYSHIVVIENEEKVVNNAAISVVPNPFQSGFDVIINSDREEEVLIEVYDALGKKVTDRKQQIDAGDSLINIDQTEAWKTGLYFVTIHINNERKIIKLLKN